MLGLFHWLDHNSWLYWALAAAATAVLLFQVFRPLIFEDPRSSRATLSFVLAILLTLLAWRWPSLLDARELNPDESQFIAGALTLKHDPVFWRAVDGTTSGAIVFYALLPLHALGLPLDYFSARLTGLLLLAGTLLGCHRLIRARHGELAARMSVAPSVLFAALATDADFLHYASELAPNALLAAAAYLLWRPASERAPGRSGRVRLAAGGAFAGLLPWAKLQAAPLGAVVVAVAALQLWRNRTEGTRGRGTALTVLIAGSLSPTLLCLALVATFASLDDFVRSAFLQNLNYVAPDNRSASIVDGFQRSPALTGSVIMLLGGTLGFSLAAFLDAGRHVRARGLHHQPTAPSVLHTLLPSTLLLATAIGCIVFPGRSSGHYLLLLLMPCTLLAGEAIGGMLSRRGPPLRRPDGLLLPAGGGAFLFLLLFPVAIASPLALRLAQPAPEALGLLAAHWRQPASQLGSLVRLLARPDRSAYVWGWNPAIYVESGAAQGARSAFSVWSIIPNPQREYYRRRDLEDFTRNRPAVFVDAVGPFARMITDRRQQGHETHPALADVVRRDYRLMADLGEARVYLRSDLLEQRQLSQADVTRALAAGRISSAIDELPRENLANFDLPQIFAHGKKALGLNPPARASWPLVGNEREVHFQYGYSDARAERNTDGNGTEFQVFLEERGGHRRLIHQFRHNPAHHPEQRGPQVMRLALPPFQPEATLEVVSSAGPDRNDAWDWAYLAEIRFRRSAAYSFNQFPGYNRPPDHAFAPLAQLGEIDDAPYLQLHAPGYLDFVLTGNERHLSFDYGFHPETYAAADRTNGALFAVDVLTLGENTQRLFEARLEPGTQPGHRGIHSATMTVPPHVRGATIRISIEDNGSAAWDWTFLRNFRLD